jgi:hypothetical protein
MQFVKLAELVTTYFQKHGYYYPGEEYLNQQHRNRNPFPRILDNQIRQQMDEHFTKAAFGGVLKFKGVQITSEIDNSNGPVSEIPIEYFREVRSFDEVSIIGYNETHDDQLWPLTLHPTQRHPHWQDVLVHTEGISKFLQTVGHFGMSLPGVSASKPNVAQLSLCEAVSLLAHGVALDRTRIAQFHDPSLFERRKLIEDCILEAESDAMYAHFPRSLPHDALELALLFFNNKTPEPWPPTAERLKKVAEEQATLNKTNGILLVRAEAAILSLARSGVLSLTGNLKNSGQRLPIPVDLFHEMLSIDWSHDVIGLDDGLNHTPDREWENVSVDAESLQQSLIQTEAEVSRVRKLGMRTNINARKRIDPAKIENWFKIRMASFKNDDLPPTIDQDWEAAKKEFPGIQREPIREIRSKVYPESWVKPGPRKTIGELKSAGQSSNC